MASFTLDHRFFESTRGRIVRLLRRGPLTTDDLVQTLGLTGTAVRTQLAALQRDGLIEVRGTKRPPGAGKPAALYALSADAEQRFSQAYVPLLVTLLGVLQERLPAEELRQLLEEVGRRLAPAPLFATGTLAERARGVADFFAALGAEIEIVAEPSQCTLCGFGCILRDVVPGTPGICHAIEVLIESLTGLAVEERCDRGARPNCRFVLTPRVEDAA